MRDDCSRILHSIGKRSFALGKEGEVAALEALSSLETSESYRIRAAIYLARAMEVEEEGNRVRGRGGVSPLLEQAELYVERAINLPHPASEHAELLDMRQRCLDLYPTSAKYRHFHHLSFLFFVPSRSTHTSLISGIYCDVPLMIFLQCIRPLSRKTSLFRRLQHH